MDARLLVRCTNAVLVAGVGMGTAHLLMPARPGAPMAARVLYVGSVAGAGALAAWRERRIEAEYRGGRIAGSAAAWAAGGGGVALLLAALAWWLVHG